MKAFRYIIFIPLVFFIIGIVYSLIPWTILGLLGMSKFWLILFLVFFGSIAVVAFTLLPGVISWLSSMIAPNKKFAFYVIFLISVLLGISRIIDFWTTPVLDGKGIGVLFSIMDTCLTIGFATSFSLGAYIDMTEDENLIFNILLAVGKYAFYFGIFLVFCILTTNICYINPAIKYNWYSGIWHAFSALPNWVVSWFSDDIYCKAPNSTVAYSIWWWIIIVFSFLVVISSVGKNRRERDY